MIDLAFPAPLVTTTVKGWRPPRRSGAVRKSVPVAISPCTVTVADEHVTVRTGPMSVWPAPAAGWIEVWFVGGHEERLWRRPVPGDDGWVARGAANGGAW